MKHAAAPVRDGLPPSRVQRLSHADQIMLDLVRLVLDEQWSADAAGRKLREHVGENRELLLRIRRRVIRGASYPAEGLDERMLLTLDHAA